MVWSSLAVSPALATKVERHLAIAQRVEKLPGGELAIGADLEVAGADAAQVHPGVGVLVGQIEPRFGWGEEFAPPALHFVGRELEGAPGWDGQQSGRGAGTDEAEEFAPIKRLGSAVSGAVAFTHSSKKVMAIPIHRQVQPHLNTVAGRKPEQPLGLADVRHRMPHVAGLKVAVDRLLFGQRRVLRTQ